MYLIQVRHPGNWERPQLAAVKAERVGINVTSCVPRIQTNLRILDADIVLVENMLALEPNRHGYKPQL